MSIWLELIASLSIEDIAYLSKWVVTFITFSIIIDLNFFMEKKSNKTDRLLLSQ